DHRVRADENPVADGRHAAARSLAGLAQGHVLLDGAVGADVAVAEDDRAEAREIEAAADLGVAWNADAGGDLDDLLRHGSEHARHRLRRAAGGQRLDQRARGAIDAARPKALREEDRAQARFACGAVAAVVEVEEAPPAHRAPSPASR